VTRTQKGLEHYAYKAGKFQLSANRRALGILRHYVKTICEHTILTEVSNSYSFPGSTYQATHTASEEFQAERFLRSVAAELERTQTVLLRDLANKQADRLEPNGPAGAEWLGRLTQTRVTPVEVNDGTLDSIDLAAGKITFSNKTLDSVIQGAAEYRKSVNAQSEFPLKTKD